MIKTAAAWLERCEETITAEERQKAKGILYGVLYGQRENSLSNNLHCTEEEASDFLKQFKQIFPGVGRFTKDYIEQCRKNGFVETLSGRRRYLPDLKSDDFGKRSSAERQCINSLCQGSAADIVKEAMIEVCEQMANFNKRIDGVPEESKCKLIMLMHDELIFEVPRVNELEFCVGP
jgi:DNA polymerase theta